VEVNLDACDLSIQATVVRADGPGWLATGLGGAAGPWDLVLLDPPYDFDGWTDLLGSLIELVAADGVVAVESDREIDAGPRWNVDSRRRTAGTVVMLLRPESDPA
jgi:16S rRNA G966 N2-methylase RsmD